MSVGSALLFIFGCLMLISAIALFFTEGGWWMALILLVVSFASCSKAEAKTARDRSAVAAFKIQQPCPSTGQARGACPGWVVDHIEPLCAGGSDAPLNMQWQPANEARAKDRHERAQCRALANGNRKR